MRQAIVAAEDPRFYEHGGVDLRGMARAPGRQRHAAAAPPRARSTLTMQYVRNVLKNDPTPTAAAAGRRPPQTPPGASSSEIRYALALEKQLSKDEILDRYLNIAYFGAGAYGIAAASQRYFGKPPARADPGRGGAAGRPGAVARTRTTRSTATSDAALDRRGRTCSTRWPTTGAITAGRGRPRPRPSR